MAVVVTVAKGYDLGTSGKPKTTKPNAPAGTTSTPPRPGNHPAAGGDQAPRPSASPPARPSTASRTRAIPQDHVHNQIARITRTFSDGKWRALDTMSVRAVLGALQAVAATAVECELTREFGVQWIPRADAAATRSAA